MVRMMSVMSVMRVMSRRARKKDGQARQQQHFRSTTFPFNNISVQLLSSHFWGQVYFETCRGDGMYVLNHNNSL